MPTPEAGLAAYPHLFAPITVGTMRLRNRVMLPPHASAIGNIYGTDEDAARNIAYFEQRVPRRRRRVGRRACRPTCATPSSPGFEPDRRRRGDHRVLPAAATSSSASSSSATPCTRLGTTRHGADGAPGRDAARRVASDERAGHQPHAARHGPRTTSTRSSASTPSRRGCRWRDARTASSCTSTTTTCTSGSCPRSPTSASDRYGGSLENRCRFAVEAMQAIRDVVGTAITVGIRLNIREEVPGGYDVAGRRGARAVLRVHRPHRLRPRRRRLALGQPQLHPADLLRPGAVRLPWPASSSARSRSRSSTPAGSTAPRSPSGCWPAGHADIVGMARAHIADGDLLVKAREGRVAEIRPCVGGNECISRRYVEGLAVRLRGEPAHQPRGRRSVADGPGPRRLLVVGGGPAGMELAALPREGGLDVDAAGRPTDELGGQLRYAVRRHGTRATRRTSHWQARRLRGLGVEVELGRRATADEVRGAVAPTSWRWRPAPARARPQIPGVDGAHVLDVRDVLAGARAAGRPESLVIAQDDHVAPLSVADHLPGAGHEVVRGLRHRPARLRCWAATSSAASSAGSTRRACAAVHGGGGRRSARPRVDGPQRLLAARRGRSASSTRSCSPAAATPTPRCTTSSSGRLARGPHPRRRVRSASPGLRHPAGLRPGRAARPILNPLRPHDPTHTEEPCCSRTRSRSSRPARREWAARAPNVFAAEGAHVIVVDFNEANAAETVDGITAAGGSAAAEIVDVRDLEALKALAEKVERGARHPARALQQRRHPRRGGSGAHRRTSGTSASRSTRGRRSSSAGT